MLRLCVNPRATGNPLRLLVAGAAQIVMRIVRWCAADVVSDAEGAVFVKILAAGAKCRKVGGPGQGVAVPFAVTTAAPTTVATGSTSHALVLLLRVLAVAAPTGAIITERLGVVAGVERR